MGAPVLSGLLSAFRLPEVLTLLSANRKSGRLLLTSDAREATLFFDEGALVYAGSNQEQFRLGSILTRKRKITQEQREQIDELMLREGRLFGQIALQNGVLTPAQLRDFLKVQVSEIVYDVFVWEGGSFAFTEERNLPSHAVTISVDLPNLIMEGARRIDEWEQCLKLLPDKSVVFRVVTAPRDEKITLTAEEWKILFLINGVRTLEDLSHDSDEDPFQVYRVVYGLYANHLIEVAPVVLSEDDTSSRPLPAEMNADATFKQHSPSFSADSTVRALPDDRGLLVSSDANLSYADVVRATIAQLLLERDNATKHVIPLSEPEYLIGRHRDNGIHLEDLGVSGFHARIFRGAEGYVIEDLKSRNGTWVNGNRISQVTLRHGDEIHIGQLDLRYEVLF